MQPALDTTKHEALCDCESSKKKNPFGELVELRYKVVEMSKTRHNCGNNDKHNKTKHTKNVNVNVN